MSNFSKPLAFYRTSSAIRITPDLGRRVFWIDGANAFPDAPKGMPEKGSQKFDWEEKLTFALSPDEALSLAECANRILHTQDGRVEFTHDPAKGGREGETKKLTLSITEVKDKDKTVKKVFFNLSQSDNKVAVVCSRADLYGIATLIPHAVASMWDWVSGVPPHENGSTEPGYNDGDDVPF